jgi:3-hydroxyacyl-CoA dehydrogenase/enoyl-CoA hydratase/3-hydroxybutyryl-CoA epimerase/enoyl-CoA isomerase
MLSRDSREKNKATYEGEMIFSGSALRIEMIDDGLANLQLDLPGESVNKLNLQVSGELTQALDVLEKTPGIRGLFITSAKTVFIVGADVMEFGPVFTQGEEAVSRHLQANNLNFNRLEDLPFPTLVAINGYALGGGLELCLACDFRLMSSTAKIGLPESKLGLIPGWGGTVRLSRLAGLDTAIEWIASGAEQSADQALKCGVVDGVLRPDALLASAVETLQRAAAGKLPFDERRQQKKFPLRHNDMEGLLAFESAKMFVGAQAGRNYPAPVAAVKAMQDGATLGREDAQKIETRSFVQLAQTSAARNLVGLFVSDQFIGKKAKQWEKQADKIVSRAAVLGAGIMGGGIAYQSASKKVPIKMKDINQKGIDQGLAEASKLLTRRVESGKMSIAEMATILTRIEPTLSYDGFGEVDLVVEAVVENPKVKKSVLEDVESEVCSGTILCSNTSTISIDVLAEGLQRPENFCGMHFFNPVHAMPLVEVIRGTKTSDLAVARTVAYANTLGKKAIVVRNCPGFLVNRVLFPYFAGFSMLLRDGADFQHIDKVMERWGWPMGPAYLLDVVGLDTAVHAQGVMAQGYPERMSKTFKPAPDILFEAGRLGQKNDRGFYNYEPDKKGKPSKIPTQETYQLLLPHVAAKKDFSDEEIIARLMIPIATELVRCYEESIVATPAEADMALIYGLGFPPFRGGIFRWLDEQGLAGFVATAKRFEGLGPLYHPTTAMVQLAADGKTYY